MDGIWDREADEAGDVEEGIAPCAKLVPVAVSSVLLSRSTSKSRSARGRVGDVAANVVGVELVKEVDVSPNPFRGGTGAGAACQVLRDDVLFSQHKLGCQSRLAVEEVEGHPGAEENLWTRASRRWTRCPIGRVHHSREKT